jgi:hypothetical protein
VPYPEVVREAGFEQEVTEGTEKMKRRTPACVCARKMLDASIWRDRGEEEEIADGEIDGSLFKYTD